MNEFDQFVKHDLGVKHYVRYTDDFIIVADSRKYLEGLLPDMSRFLNQRLFLELHPKKVGIRTVYQGIDFLGYITFPKHRILRTKTKRRMMRVIRDRMQAYRLGSISRAVLEHSLQSYLGVLSHADAHVLSEYLKNWFWFEMGV